MSATDTKTLHLNEQDFDETIRNAAGPVLVDFWATWCPPCKALGPIVDGLAARYDGDAIVAKVDVDANPSLATRFGVQSIPTLILFKDGREVDRLVGLAPEDRISKAIDTHLN